MFTLIEDVIASRPRNKESLFSSCFRFVTDLKIAEISLMKTIAAQLALQAHSDVSMVTTGEESISECQNLID